MYLDPPPSDFLDPPLKGAVNQRPGPYTPAQWTGSGLGEGLGGRVSLTREVHRCLAECLRSHLTNNVVWSELIGHQLGTPYTEPAS